MLAQPRTGALELKIRSKIRAFLLQVLLQIRALKLVWLNFATSFASSPNPGVNPASPVPLSHKAATFGLWDKGTGLAGVLNVPQARPSWFAGGVSGGEAKLSSNLIRQSPSSLSSAKSRAFLKPKLTTVWVGQDSKKKTLPWSKDVGFWKFANETPYGLFCWDVVCRKEILTNAKRNINIAACSAVQPYLFNVHPHLMPHADWYGALWTERLPCARHGKYSGMTAFILCSCDLHTALKCLQLKDTSWGALKIELVKLIEHLTAFVWIFFDLSF